jgi:hypothetical protein
MERPIPSRASILVPFVIGVMACTTRPPATQDAPIPISEHFATTPDSVRLYYRVAGAGETTVLAPFALFHGSALDSLGRRHRVITYDPRGRGRSDPVGGDKVSLGHLLLDLVSEIRVG